MNANHVKVNVKLLQRGRFNVETVATSSTFVISSETFEASAVIEIRRMIRMTFRRSYVEFAATLNVLAATLNVLSATFNVLAVTLNVLAVTLNVLAVTLNVLAATLNVLAARP